MSASHHLLPLLTAFFRTLLQASWQGSFAILLVLVVRRVLGARVPARWHYLLWFLVLVRLLVPAFVLPRSPASLDNIHAVARPFAPSPGPSPRQETADHFIVAPAPDDEVRPRHSSPVQLHAVPPGSVRPAWSKWELAALAWLAGAGVLGGWLVVCSVRLGRMVRRQTSPADPAIVAVWQSCCRRWLHRAPPRMLLGDWVHSPALVGLWRPTLLLPRQTPASFSTQDWEHVFAHEIAHLRWCDHWSQLLSHLAWCAHWFNPVVWLGLRRLRADRELAADDWALRHLTAERSLAYGETLFKTVANRPAGSSFQPGLVGISEDGAQIKQRLRRITAFLPRRRLYGSLTGLAALLVLATVVLGQSSSGPTPNARAKGATPAIPGSSPAPSDVAGSPDAALQERGEAILAAARAGDGVKVAGLMRASDRKFSLSAGNVTQLLNGLIQRRELTGFSTLLEEAQHSGLGKDWKISDPLLTGLVKDGRTDFLDALLAHGLAPDRLSQEAKSADQPTAEWIARRVTEETQRRAAIDALGVAAEAGDISVVSRLVAAGADVNGVGQDNSTPLIRAVSKDRLGAAQWLLDHGAQVDKPRFPGYDYTPLCLVNSVPMAELLKQYGANVHAKLYGRDVSILTYVVRFASPEVVAWFLQQGLDPKMIEDNNRNLLFGLKDGRTANLLLDTGANPNQVDDSGDTPIVDARSAAVAQALIDHGAKITGFPTPLLPRLVSQFAPAEVLAAVLKAGADQDPTILHETLYRAGSFGAEYPEENKIHQLLLAYGAKPIPAAPTPAPEIKCEGAVSVADGGLVDFSALHVFESESYGENSNGSLSRQAYVDLNGIVQMQIQPNDATASFALVAPGFATVFAGPFTPPTKEKVDGTRFVLTRGFEATILTVDEAGHPIPGAQLKSWYPGPPSVDFAAATTDAAGSAVLKHIGTAPLAVQVSANGYQADQLPSVHLDPAQPYRWTLKPAQALGGSVTAAATGQPIAGAKIRLGAVRGPFNETNAEASRAPLLASTDAQGRFVLSSLRPDSQYYLFVEAPGFGGVLLREVKVGQPELKVALGPELFVRGKFRHIPAESINGYDGTFTFGSDQFFDFGGSFYAVGQQGRVKPKDGEADFFVTGLYDNSFEIIAEDKEVKLEAKDLPKSDLVIDFAAAPTPPAGAVAPPYVIKPPSARTPAPVAAKPPSTGEAAVTLAGTVTAAGTGLPISDAKVKLAAIQWGGTEPKEPQAPPQAWTLATASILTSTDAQGRFVLPDLRPATTYCFFVEAAGYGGAYVAVDKLPAAKIEVKLGQERFIHGRIVHAPTSMIHKGKLSLSYRQEFGADLDKEPWTTLTLEPKNGEADFTAGPFYLPEGADPYRKSPVTLRVDGKELAYFKGEDLPATDYVLDLTPNLGNLDGEYKTSPDAPWTLDFRKDGTAYYYSTGSRATARYSLTGDVITFTFPDGFQDQLTVDGSQLIGMPGNVGLPTWERLKRQ